VDPAREAYIEACRARAHALYEGVRTPHRSCGIAIAETFGVPSRSYQALRKGGITGDGPCGAIAAGTLLLGELLGDPDPTGPVTPLLRDAVTRYRASIAAKISGAPDDACNLRTAPFPEFLGPDRKRSCTDLAALVAATVAEVLWDAGRAAPLPPPPWDAS